MTKIALITGANRGLGLETARQLGRTGVTTIIAGRDRQGGAAATELRREGLDAGSVQLDVTSPASVQAAAQHVQREHGRLDILINNAGILPEATAERQRAFDKEMFGRPARRTCSASSRSSKSSCRCCASRTPGASSTSRARWARSPSRAIRPRPGTRSSSPRTCLKVGAQRGHRRTGQAAQGHADQGQLDLPRLGADRPRRARQPRRRPHDHRASGADHRRDGLDRHRRTERPVRRSRRQRRLVTAALFAQSTEFREPRCASCVHGHEGLDREVCRRHLQRCPEGGDHGEEADLAERRTQIQ